MSLKVPIYGLIFLVLIISVPLILEVDPSRAASTANDRLALNGTIFQDVNGDGIFSSEELGLSNWTIHLLQNGHEISNIITDARGHYKFISLAPGSYQIVEEKKSGWNQTLPGSGSYWLNLSDKSAYNLDFGNIHNTKSFESQQYREQAIMQPNLTQAQNWIGLYLRSQRAYLNPAIAAKLAVAPGESYSLLNYLSYNPSERNQGYCGNCWAWAGTGALEIDRAIKAKTKERLSVQYLDSNFNGGCGKSSACCGAWLNDFVNFYSGAKKIVPWSNANAQYQDGSIACGSCSSVPAISISTDLSYALNSIDAQAIQTQAMGKENAINNIKNILKQGKAVWFGFFLPTDTAWQNFKGFWNSQSEESVWRPDFACGSVYSFSTGGGHAVLCVGYDDKDPNNRYWIMLNSWGNTPGRPNGLFRVNMDMNYDCQYLGLGYAFYWMSLDIGYAAKLNHPPSKPKIRNNSNNGYADREITYSASAEDSDGDQIILTFDWGDNTTFDTEFIDSGNNTTASHYWSKPGIYQVRAMASDSFGSSSPWSDSLIIKISSRSVHKSTESASGRVKMYPQNKLANEISKENRKINKIPYKSTQKKVDSRKAYYFDNQLSDINWI